ncbi:MAG: PorT family protein [Prevotellaceae bacterium]|jgi:hypothetical protein|nr:PorT family protein [Prevotellaceae bacterium]
MTNDKLNKNFEELIRNKLEDYEIPVDTANWDSIEKSLLKSKRIKYIYTAVGVAAAAAVLLFLTLNLPKNNDAADTLSGKQETVEQQPLSPDVPEQNVPGQNKPDTEKEQDAKNQAVQNQSASTTVLAYNHVETNIVKTQTDREPEQTPDDPPLREKIRILPQNSSLVLPNLSSQSKLQIPAPKAKANDLRFPKNPANQTSGKPDKKADELGKKDAVDDDISITNPAKKKTWSLAMSLGAGNYQDPGTNSKNSDLVVAAPILTSNNTEDYVRNKYRNEVMIPDNSDYQHGIPLSAKLLVRKNLNSRWAVESGLSYSYLSTKYKWNKNLATQQLHYLGIPLNVVFYAVSKPNWNIYASAGGMLEKGVYASMRRSDDVDSKINMHGQQWSVNGSVGATYKLYRSLGLFFEPQFGYFFDSKQPESMRTAWPVSVSLGAGIRFNF